MVKNKIFFFSNLNFQIMNIELSFKNCKSAIPIDSKLSFIQYSIESSKY